MITRLFTEDLTKEILVESRWADSSSVSISSFDRVQNIEIKNDIIETFIKTSSVEKRKRSVKKSKKLVNP